MISNETTPQDDTYCVHCGDANATQITRSGEACDGCLEDYEKCHRCDVPTHPDDIGHTRNGLAICHDPCIPNHYSYCDSCEVYVLDEYFHSGLDQCDRCVRENYVLCDSCAEWCSDDYIIVRDHGAFCESCDDGDERPEGVHNYKDGAPWGRNFISTTPLGTETREPGNVRAYFGVEVEMEGSAYDIGDILAKCEREQDGHAETDSSVEGIEWISQPASLGAWRAHYGARVSLYLADLRDRGYSAGTKECGAHVHISRAAFDGARHVATFAAFFTYNDDFITSVSGRDERALERWASVRKFAPKELSNTARGLRGGDRYRAVNMRNRETLEVRVFTGSDYFADTLGSIEMIHALCEYTRDLTSGDVLAGALLADSFVAWMSDPARDGERYPHALAVISDRASGDLLHGIA